MAQAAWQGPAGFESDIVRRLVARPLRRASRETSAAATLTLIPRAEPETIEEDDGPSPDVLRLRTEVTLMKAVLKAERSENAELRAQIEQAGLAFADDARHVRDRWSTLVDQLLRQPR